MWFFSPAGLGVAAVAVLSLLGLHKVLLWDAVADARDAEKAACEERIADSIEAADEIDRTTLQNAIANALAAASSAEARAAAAEERNADYARDIEALPQAVRRARAATDADIRRLSRPR